MTRNYTPRELETIRKYYKAIGARMLGLRLQRSHHAIRVKAHSMGLTNKAEELGWRNWTSEEDAVILSLSRNKAALKLNRSKGSVCGRFAYLKKRKQDARHQVNPDSPPSL